MSSYPKATAREASLRHDGIFSGHERVVPERRANDLGASLVDRAGCCREGFTVELRQLRKRHLCTNGDGLLLVGFDDLWLELTTPLIVSHYVIP
jgi:hypothetical protein